MSYPTAWKRYTAACSHRGERVDPSLARFAARYRMAANFEGLDVTGLGQQALQAYAAAFRCALAYSALETLDSALGSRRSRTPVISPDVARMLAGARHERLLALLDEELDDPALTARVRSVADDPHSDVTALAKGVRHAVVHGGFTAYGSGAAQSAAIRELLEGLAEATLLAADERFEAHLDTHVIGPWDDPVQDSCPSCGCPIGVLHERDCDVSRCANHGDQLSACEGAGRHRPTHYRGVYPGTVEALKRGWLVTRGNRQYPDINKVLVSLTWSPQTEQFE